MSGAQPSLVAAVTLLLALALELLCGEPPALLHPVVWMGRWAGWLERRSPKQGPLAQLAAGALISDSIAQAGRLVKGAAGLATTLALITLMARRGITR